MVDKGAMDGVGWPAMVKKVRASGKVFLDTVTGQAAAVPASSALDPSEVRQLTKEGQKYKLAGFTDGMVEEVIALMEQDGTITVDDVKQRYALTEHRWLALRRYMDDCGRGFNRTRWARHTAASLARFTSLGAERLAKEVGEIPLASLPIAVAIAVDKLILLSSDRPAVIVEARLRLTADDLSLMLSSPAAAVPVPAPAPVIDV